MPVLAALWIPSGITLLFILSYLTPSATHVIGVLFIGPPTRTRTRACVCVRLSSSFILVHLLVLFRPWPLGGDSARGKVPKNKMYPLATGPFKMYPLATGPFKTYPLATGGRGDPWSLIHPFKGSPSAPGGAVMAAAPPGGARGGTGLGQTGDMWPRLSGS